MPRPEEEVYSEEQNAARMLTVDEAREFINQHEWTFAKTMPWCPHWYVVRRNVDNDKFVGFVKLIRAEGEIRPWSRYRHTYLDIDGYQYWTPARTHRDVPRLCGQQGHPFDEPIRSVPVATRAGEPKSVSGIARSHYVGRL